MANISKTLEPEVRARALVRIGYYDDTKKRGRQEDYRRILGWFVNFARKSLANMSPGEQLSLREEIRALQEERFSLGENDPEVANHLAETQKAVALDLKTLIETGRVHSEKFMLEYFTFLPRFAPKLTEPFKHSIYTGMYVEPFNGKGLLQFFHLSLQNAGVRLMQCPHCSALFVQARRKQRFCNRDCQQVASMRTLRYRRNKEREARKRRGTSTQSKKRADHGKKRR